MRKLFLILTLLTTSTLTIAATPMQLYAEIGLEGIMSYDLFENGLRGYDKIGKKNSIITFIDFTKSSVEKRLFVVDLEQKKLLFNTYVSHGRNSGEKYANSFSNKSGSYQSSLGFYVTKGTYQGKNGYSLRLGGLEEGINDKAEERSIVIHGANYSNPEVIKQNGRLGRSLGCPALPTAISKEIIDTIKDGSVLFIYANNSDYREKSRLL